MEKSRFLVAGFYCQYLRGIREAMISVDFRRVVFK